MELIKPGRQFDFMRYRWHFIGASLTLLVLSIASFIYPGAKLGTDFKGGTELEVAFKQQVNAGDVRAAVERVGFEAPEVVADTEHQNRFLIRVQEVTVLSDAEKALIRQKMCLVGEDGKAPAGCKQDSPASSASEIKFSPGGDKIFSRYEIAPDLVTIKQQLATTEGIQLRA